MIATANEDLYCAECGTPIKDTYFMVNDPFLRHKYFDDLDELDNIFCSKACLCKALTVRERTIENYRKEHQR